MERDRQREPSGTPQYDAAVGKSLGGGVAQASSFASETTDAGEQTLVPGVRPVTERDLLERRAQAPLLPRRLQQPIDFGLFDLNARNQLDLF